MPDYDKMQYGLSEEYRTQMELGSYPMAPTYSMAPSITAEMLNAYEY